MKEGKLMPRIKSDEKGFTLIEVIVTLVLVGITTALAGMWIVSVANGYVFAKMNANTVQKGQLAMARLTKEFSAMEPQSVTGESATGITFNRVDIDNTGIPIVVPITVSGSGDQLLLNGNPLTDSVSTFNLNYCNNNFPTPTCSSSWSATTRIIEVTLRLKGANNTTSEFKTHVTPRNI